MFVVGCEKVGLEGGSKIIHLFFVGAFGGGSASIHIFLELVDNLLGVIPDIYSAVVWVCLLCYFAVGDMNRAGLVIVFDP